MNKALILVVSLVVIGGIGLFLLGSEGDDAKVATNTNNQTSTQNIPDQNEAANDTGVEDEARTIDISMREHAFSEAVIEASPGETITINLTNSGGSHDFVIDELNVASQEITAGGSTSVTFTIPESAAGQTYDFYCSVSNHRELGMEGQLVISE